MRSVILACVVAQCAALVRPCVASASVRSSSRPRATVLATESSAPSKEEMEKLVAMRNKQLAKQVEAMIVEFPKKLASGVAPPPALAKLNEAYKAEDAAAMFLGIYEVTIEGECTYQVNADQLLEPFNPEIDWTNTDDEVVKAKMKYLYSMGLRMLGSAGPETTEKIKQMVMEKLVKRVGLDGKAFDDWLL